MATTPAALDETRPLGVRLRARRKELGLTLDDLTDRTGISKPYLSLIETGRVSNPPSDEKLKALERALGFAPEELLTQASLQRTPERVRRLLRELAGGDLDAALRRGALQQMADEAGNTGASRLRPVPLVNVTTAGQPADFTDLGHPPGVADHYVGAPDLDDPDAFAVRVVGDSMTPKYREGDVVIFSPAAPVRDGDDCFVRFDDGQTTFKRVFHESDATGGTPRGVLRLQPRNETYRPQTVPAEKVAALFRAVWRYEKVDG